MIRDVVLAVHISAGTAGLLFGPAFLATTGRLRWTCGRAYQIAVAGVAVSGATLAVTAWDRLWWLLPVAVATEASALLGLRMWRRRGPSWPAATAHVLGGSYVALVTGVLIAGTKNPVFWIIPAVVAQWPIAVAKRRLAAQAAEIPPPAPSAGSNPASNPAAPPVPVRTLLR